MIDTFYFGRLQINVKSDYRINWKENERKFFFSSMNPIKVSNTDIETVDKLPNANGKCIRNNKSVQIYISEKEDRIYIPTFCGNQNPCAYSCVSDDKSISVKQLFDLNLINNPNYNILTMIHLEQLLLSVDALILHSCYTEYQNEAILFTAPSGTGKTTQANLWKKNYDISIINGDKCLLQKYNETYYACGFFLSGSAEECENKSMPIKAIVIVRQDKEDYIEEISDANKVGLLYSEITINDWNFDFVNKSLDLLEDLISKIPVLILHCTMEDHAAHVLHDYLYGG